MAIADGSVVMRMPPFSEMPELLAKCRASESKRRKDGRLVLSVFLLDEPATPDRLKELAAQVPVSGRKVFLTTYLELKQAGYDLEHHPEDGMDEHYEIVFGTPDEADEILVDRLKRLAGLFRREPNPAH